MIDIVFPDKNEEEFIQMAERLGIPGLIFAYKNKQDFYAKKAKIPITNALLAQTKNSNITTICPASREAIERGADIVYGFELLEQKDHTHYRKSGLNQVLCKLAAQKNVKIGFAFSTILNTTGQKQAILLGRIMQNIKLCNKYKIKIHIVSFAKDKYEMKSANDTKSMQKILGIQ